MEKSSPSHPSSSLAGFHVYPASQEFAFLLFTGTLLVLSRAVSYLQLIDSSGASKGTVISRPCLAN